jgi:raffinose/stachyose/melibiose transport system substrate-binding protein
MEKRGKNMKKRLIVTFVLVFVVSMLFFGIGCKTQAAVETTAAATTAAATAAVETTAAATTAVEETMTTEPVKLVWMSMWNPEEQPQIIINDMLDQYTKDHPNVTIERIWGGREVNTSVMASIQAGNPPDIYDDDLGVINNSIGKEDMALELSDLIKNTDAYNEDKKLIDIYAPGFLDSCMLGDKLYCFPWNQYVSVFWYNKTLFTKLGISSTPNTWSEFLALCETIKGKDIPPLVQDGGINFYNSYYLTWLVDRILGMNAFRETALDKTGASWDNPGILQAAKMVNELYTKGYFIKGFEGYQWPAGQIDWAQGAGAMMLNHTYLPIEIKDSLPEDFVFGAFPFPAVEGGKGNQYELDSIPSVVSILKSSKYPDIALDVAKRILGEEVQLRTINEAWTLPVRPGTKLPAQFVDLENIFSKQTGSFRAYAGGPSMIEPEWELTVFYPLDDQLLFGKITPEDFVKQIKEQSIAFWAGK